MNKKGTLIAIVAIALMLAGIAWAVSRLYRDEKPRQKADDTEYPLLRAVPADAAAVFCFDGTPKAQRAIADSTGILKAFIAPESPALMAYLSKAGAARMAVSLHNSGSLVPLVASEMALADSASLASFEPVAARAGLKTAYQDGLLLASTSETLLNAACRALDSGVCILEAPGLPDLTGRIGGSAVAFLSAEANEKHIVLKGTAACPEKGTSFLSALRGLKMPAASFPDALPYFADYAVSIPIGDVSSYLERYRSLAYSL